jgi:type VI secretion system protein VasJ
MFGDLRRALEELASSAPPPAAARPERDTSQAAAVESAPSGPPPIDTVSTAEEYDRAFEELARLADLCAGYLREQEPANPIGYRLPRLLRWSQVRETPPNEDGVTIIPDPDVTVLEGLDQALGSSDYAAALAQTEGLFPNALLWLDLNHYAVRALEGQGEEFAAAAEGVTRELAALLKRAPELVNLKTVGGVPLAGEATRQWIAKRVLAGSGIDLGPSPTAAAGARPRGGEGFAAALQDAKKLVRQKKFGEAIGLLEKGAQRAERLDDRVAWKLEVARLCMNAGRDEMALAQLEALDEELRGSTIDQWDPPLCAEVLKALLLCRRKVAAATEPGPAEVARARELMGRLCRVDLMAALELDGRR